MNSLHLYIQKTSNSMRFKKLDRLFNIALFLKTIHACIEIISGFLLLIIHKSFITKQIVSLFAIELNEDPRDYLVNIIVKSAQSFSTEVKIFLSIYLMAVGSVNLLLVYGLKKNKLLVYPIASLVFSVFIIYQSYKYALTGSLWLLLLNLLDIIAMCKSTF